jgi:hypothetical protein
MSIDWKERMGYKDSPLFHDTCACGHTRAGHEDGGSQQRTTMCLDETCDCLVFSEKKPWAVPPGDATGWSDYEDEAEAESRRCRERDIPYVISEHTLSGKGSIHDLPSLKKVQLADIAYLDGELIKHRWKTGAQIRAEQDGRRKPAHYGGLPDTLAGLAELYADMHEDAPPLELLSPGGHKKTCVIPLCVNGAVWSSKLRPPELDYICVECVRSVIRRKLDETKAP